MPVFKLDSKGPAEPFTHYWEFCVGSGHAVMGLRRDWQEQLEKTVRELGFKYVRFHGILDDDMSVCVRDGGYFETGENRKVRYNFHNIDLHFDFLLGIGVKPFVELSFMPQTLASGSQTCFHYRANVTPPRDYAEWVELISRLTEHLIDRYGIDEVRAWPFEVWNEPNLPFFFAGTRDDYFKLYEHTARAIKAVDGEIKVGGPATSINAWVAETVEFCRENNVPLDFISTHHYPSDDPLWRNSELTPEEFFKQNAGKERVYKRGVLKEMAGRTREAAGCLPLFYTEWNSSAQLPDNLHDAPYSAALVAKALADNHGIVDAYAFWTFSDLFEERGQFGGPFHGGFGLQTIQGIAKPTYRVFEMFHRLGSEKLEVAGEAHATVEALAVRGGDTLHVLVFNHNVQGEAIGDENVIIHIENISDTAGATLARVDDYHGNAKKLWNELGSPQYPSFSEINEMMKASELADEDIPVKNDADAISVGFIIPAHGVALLTFKQQNWPAGNKATQLPGIRPVGS